MTKNIGQFACANKINNFLKRGRKVEGLVNPMAGRSSVHERQLQSKALLGV